MKLLSEALIVVTLGAFTAFITLNIMTGCVDWSEANCITPGQLWEYVVSWN